MPTKSYQEASQELLYGSYDASDLIIDDAENNKHFEPSNSSGEDGEPIVELIPE